MMRQQGGFYWPDHDKTGADCILRHAAKHFPGALKYVRGRTLAVQAGGNVGVYPASLAKSFKQVLTFEPDAENFSCLRRNTEGIPNLTAANVGLGSGPSRAALFRNPDNAGAYKIIDGDEFDLISIDSLGLDACDLIWLDVEGHEEMVLEGARETVSRFRPTVILEDMGIGETFGRARALLKKQFDYREVTKILNDFVMVPC